MTLAIISHTEHYKTSDGTIVGWSPTVHEINHLLEVFDTIYHVAMLHESTPPASTMAYADERIVFVPLRPSGGKSLSSKLRIIWQAPEVIRTVNKTLKQVDCFQLRTPTGIGVYLIPYLTFFSKKQGWYKYAGNWNQKRAPLGYRLQRFMLKHQSRKVTINGQWENQPKHCVTFENPCLTIADLNLGVEVVKTKSVEGKLTFCFVGRLERAKGAEVIIKAFGLLTDLEKQGIGSVHFVGDGVEATHFKTLADSIADVDFLFHGFLSRAEVFKIYEASHVFMLPSMASEGFPKVIAEALNFGCVPIVSKVSSISQYISKHNGIVIKEVTINHMVNALKESLNISNSMYHKVTNNSTSILYKFTYDYYNKRILGIVSDEL